MRNGCQVDELSELPEQDSRQPHSAARQRGYEFNPLRS